MNIKKPNEIFAYAFFIVGVLKLLVIILALTQATSNLNAITSGGEMSTVDYSSFNGLLGVVQIILAIGSIVMIILNIKQIPKVISSYGIYLGALFLELVSSGIFVTFFCAGTYMKVGVTIKKKAIGDGSKNYEKIKKNTDWFYGDEEK